MQQSQSSNQAMSLPLKKLLKEEGSFDTNTSAMLIFAQNDRLDSIKLGSTPYTDYTSHSACTFKP